MSSNTARNSVPGKPFVKGDPRINRNGRPKSFDSWRAMLTEIMAEPAVGKDGLMLIKIPKVVDGRPVLDEHGAPVMIDHYATNAEMVARSWLKDPKRQTALVENTFGKVPQALDVEQKGKVEIVVTYADKSDTP